MGNAAKRIDRRANRVDAPVDVSRARIVRRGQIRLLHLTLRAMREAAGLTQAQVEKRSGLKQPEISKLEAESSLDERQVSTVRRYLAALGDELELVSVSKHGHRIGIAPARVPKEVGAVGTSEELTPTTHPGWEQVFAVVAGASIECPPKTPADQHAWSLIWAGLKHFGAPVDHAITAGGKVFPGRFSDVTNEHAYKALVGGKKISRHRYIERYVESMLDAAKRNRGFAGAARLICEHMGRESADATKLAQMLENVVEPKKSGRLRAGTFTRAQIVQWLTGEKWKVKR
jgi:transcriptional regulator with XRE-family HTH domain